MDAEKNPVRVTGLAAGGDGVGHLEDGRVVFIEGGVPGDSVVLSDLTMRARMARARIGELREPSASRTSPRCAHFEQCGGCQWQHVEYAAQLRAKQQILQAALERIGGFEGQEVPEIVGSPDPYRYRTRARLQETEGGRLGYRRKGSHEIIIVSECPVLVPAAEAALLEGVPAKQGGRSPEWEILAGSDSESKALVTRTTGQKGSPVRAELEVLGESLSARSGSFVQGNVLLWEPLAAEVLHQALGGTSEAPPRPGNLIELYAGIGFLTLPLARAGFHGIACESGREAVRDLKENLRRAGLSDRMQVLAGRVEQRKDWDERLARADVLVMDPPRTGLAAPMCSAIERSGPARCVYVSCDPATLARDLRALVAAGYRVAELKAFDLFPQTAHVETVVRLERSAV